MICNFPKAFSCGVRGIKIPFFTLQCVIHVTGKKAENITWV